MQEMWLLPSRDQWKNWSLPSKLTAIGAYAGIVGIPLAVILFALSIYLPGRGSSPPPASLSHAGREQIESAPGAASLTTGEFSRNGSGLSESDLSAGGYTRTPEFLDALLADLKSKDLTELQKNQIRKRLAGQRVQWSGYVRQTTVIGGSDAQAFLLIWTPTSQIRESFPDLLAATFLAAHEAEITALRKNDFVVIEGAVSFTEEGLGTWVPKLTDSKLLSVKTDR